MKTNLLVLDQMFLPSMKIRIPYDQLRGYHPVQKRLLIKVHTSQGQIRQKNARLNGRKNKRTATVAEHLVAMH